VDTLSAIAAMIAAGADAASATDSPSGAAIFVASMAETGSAADTSNGTTGGIPVDVEYHSNALFVSPGVLMGR